MSSLDGGILIKIDSGPAVASQQELVKATDKAFETVEKQGRGIVALEQQMVKLGQTTKQAVVGGGTGSDSSLNRFQSYARGLTDYGRQAAASGKETTTLVEKVRGLNQEFRVIGGSRGASTLSFFSRLASAAGQSGAARSLGLVGTAARALLGSLNPLGVAASLAAGAIIAVAVNSLQADTALDKLKRQASEATEKMDTLGAVFARVDEKISTLKSSRTTGGAFDIANTDATIEKVREFQESIGAAIATIEQAEAKDRKYFLNIEQISELREELKLTEDDILRIEKLSKSKNVGDAIKSFDAGKLRLTTDTEKGYFSDTVNVVLKARDAVQALTVRYNEAGQALRDLTRRQQDSTKGWEEQLEAIQKQAAAESLGNEERRATAALEELAAKRNGNLTERQRDLAAAVLYYARSLDRRRAALAENAKAEAELSQAEAQRRRDAEQFGDQLQKLREESQVLGQVRSQRERDLAVLQLTDSARNAGLIVTDAYVAALRREVDAKFDAAEAGRELDDAEHDLNRSREQAQRLAERRSEFLAQNADDIRILTSATEAQVKASERQAEVNNVLRQLEAQRGSAEADEIERAVRRRQAAEDYATSLQKIERIGGEVGATIGDALGTAAFQAGNFGSNLKVVLRNMLELEARRQIIENLRLAGQALGRAIFTTTPDASAPTGSGTQLPVGSGPGGTGGFGQRGMIFPGSAPGIDTWAQSGALLNTFGTIQRHGRRVGVAEGGPSTPEAIFPLQRDSFGRLGLGAPSGVGGTTVVVNGVRSAADMRRVRPTVRQTIEQVERSRSRWRGGVRAG